METNKDDIVKAMIKLFKLPYSQVDDISSIEVLLKDALVEMPKNATVAISLLQAKVMLGKTEEAVSLAENIWSVGGAISKKTESLYISLLNSLCMFNYSKAILDNKLELSYEDRTKTPDIGNLFLNCYVGLGDIEKLKKISGFEELQEKSSLISDFCDQIIKDGGDNFFEKQQKVLRRTLLSKCSSYEVLLSDDDGYPEIEIGIFSGGDSVNRYQLQQKIDETYNNFYDNAQHIPLDNFLITVYDIKEHWAFDGSIEE